MNRKIENRAWAGHTLRRTHPSCSNDHHGGPRAASLSLARLLVPLALLPVLFAACKREPDAKEGVATLQQAFPDAAAPPAIQFALAAAQTNELGQGVVALQEAKRVPGMTAEQLQSVEQASQALTRELMRRADAGDARAKADLELIERSRSQ